MIADMHPARQTNEVQRALIADEAAMWRARLATGSADPAAFAQWRDASPAHAVAMARVTAAWEALDAVPDTAVAPPAPTRRRVLRAAAVVAAGGLGAGLLIQRAAAWPRAETAIGERKLVSLGRHGRAMLNTDSALAWHAGEDGLRLRLERGEVALHLDDAHAALLEAGDTRSTLSAGRFNARRSGARLEVAVLGGMARIGTATAGLRQTLLVGPDGGRAVSAPDGIARALAWQGGEILFQDEPLADAIADYNRYLPRKIVIADPALGAIRVGGRFTTTDPEPFLRGLRDGLGIAVEGDADGFTLHRK